MIDLNITWFILYAVLIIGYAILDGFDFGVGVLSLFARGNQEKRIHMNSIGPVWDGNEVWLLTAGGALFAAFPIVYATVFSGFYLALMLVLTALIARAVSFEFRNKVDSDKWRKIWDWSFGLGSLLPAVLFGVAVGNIMRGVPIDGNGAYLGTFLGLLNPYSILIGVVTLVMFVMHGAIYMTLKTDGELRARMTQWATGGWIAFVVLYFLATIYSFFEAGYLFDNMFGNILFWVFFIVLLVAIAVIPVMLKAKKYFISFLGSSAVILTIIGMTAVNMFPRMVPSSIDLAYSLTIYNASSTPRTLETMLYIALIGMPIVLVYTFFVYRIFKGKTVINEQSY
ncbi:MAG: cytochrome d ubiquinol oxidase subunit II [Candidatus Zixiibacteriota bacterium]